MTPLNISQSIASPGVAGSDNRIFLRHLSSSFAPSLFDTADMTIIGAPVLVVDDEDNLRHAMKRFVESLGHSTAQASTLADALKKVGSCSLVILDMNLPDGLGLAVLQRIRDDHLKARVAVISGAEEHILTQAEELGAELVFRKPLPTAELAYWLNECLHGSTDA